MEITYTEEAGNKMIAQHSRRFFKDHMAARVLRRTLPKNHPERNAGERLEHLALADMITTIETVDGPYEVQP